MQEIDWRDYIVSDERILVGKPTIRGTRLSVEFVLDLLAAGWDRESLHDNYPQLTDDGIRGALAYAADIVRHNRAYSLAPVADST